ncbi:MAG: flagellar protein [Firmicutes bacterium]|nr:flagellar protein [Bacillota bacterium]
MADQIIPLGLGPLQSPEIKSGQRTPKPANTGASVGQNGSFGQILAREMGRSEPLKFSAHAEKRLETRKIPLTEADLARLRTAVDKAAAKGAQESLILMNDLALVVSIKNRTVITAIDGANLKENVFTNIDSAVIT